MTLFLVTFLKTFTFFYEKKSVMKIIEKKVATNSSRDAEKLLQNEGHDVYNTFSERRAPPGGEKGNTAAWARTSGALVEH